ncbi:recombinase family protein [Microlunatus sp. Y2014]|uniref:recombinase family protein n=1 Tax=Microlunatus sp. Y2014 TaxID=3418488 RepID=UPI003DA79855
MSENPGEAYDDAAGRARFASAPKGNLRLALYARCSTEDLQSPEDSLNWQRRAATAFIARIDPEAQIVATYFDVGQSRSLPWRRRVEAQRLLRDLDDPNRAWDAIVVGEGKRCWYGSQFAEVAPVAEHRGVTLYIPEIGGAYDPKNNTHYTLMTLTGGMSRGERQTVQERVRHGMAAQVETSGRFQGGQPPYGYRVESTGQPHPNPRKAAEGFELKRLVIDPDAAIVVRRIFDDFLSGRSLRTIATRLNRAGVACPSARDRARNQHRQATGWQLSTVRAILENPRYTGYEAWGKFQKVEVLVNPDDPSWGHLTRLRRADCPPVRSREQTHEAIVTVDEWLRVQSLKARKTAEGTRGDRVRRTRTVYALQGLIQCASCDRTMNVERYNTKTDDAERPQFVRYRCRGRDLVPGSPFSVAHPSNVEIKQGVVLDLVMDWLGGLFAPNQRATTVAALTDVASAPNLTTVQARELRERRREAETRLARLYDSIEVGVDPVRLKPRIDAVEAEIEALSVEIGLLPDAEAPTVQEIKALVDDFADLSAEVFRPDADPAELHDLFRALGLRLIWDQLSRRLEADVSIGPEILDPHTPELDSEGGCKGRVRGGT